MRVMAAPIEVLQRDLQRMRWSEIGKDTVQVATQVVIMLVSSLTPSLLLLLSISIGPFADSHLLAENDRFLSC